MTGANFKKDRGFRGTSKFLKPANHRHSGLEAAERSWAAEATESSLKTVVNGIGHSSRQPSHRVLDHSFEFPVHGEPSSYVLATEKLVPGTDRVERAIIFLKLAQTYSTSSAVMSGYSGRLISSG